MRSRTMREGSVGLLILVALALFGGLIVWLRGVDFGKSSYDVTIKFNDANRLKVGAPVRYLGVDIGTITSIVPVSDGVNATVEVTDADLRIPTDVIILANQSGFIGETSVDIKPLKDDLSLPLNKSTQPTSKQCDSTLIICEGDRIPGQIGSSFDELLLASLRFAEIYSSEEFVANINNLTKNANAAASQAAVLSKELALLSRQVRQELGAFTGTAKSITRATDQTSARLGIAIDKLSLNADVTSAELGNTARQYGSTAVRLNELATNVNSLVVDNRGSLVTTLNSLGTVSNEMRGLVANLNSSLDANSSRRLINNLETLTANAAQASNNLEALTANASNLTANLENITSTFSEEENLLLLQQTLDSARVTFENVQKITSDVDELTGDPEFRNNLLKLVNGLSNLVSSTEILEQQIETAKVLDSVNVAIENSEATLVDLSAIPQTDTQTFPLYTSRISRFLTSQQQETLNKRTIKK